MTLQIWLRGDSNKRWVRRATKRNMRSFIFIHRVPIGHGRKKKKHSKVKHAGAFKEQRAAFVSYRGNNVFTGALQPDVSSGTADLADNVERLRLLAEMLQIRTGIWNAQKCTGVAYFLFASAQLRIKSTYKRCHHNFQMWFWLQHPFQTPELWLPERIDGRTFTCGLCGGGRKIWDVKMSVDSDRNKNVGECGALSYGESWRSESCGAGVTLLCINQPEGNDGRGSDYSNSPLSPPCPTSRISVLDR